MFKHRSNGRVFVISIDGVPYNFMQQQMAQGRFPNFKRLTQHGSLRRMNSVHPCLSSVAWSSYMTGKNPAQHNIFGFVERKAGSYDLFMPTSRDMRGVTIWEIMSAAG
ncbi:alkaline phosphatase family protein, partial [candidate division KSB1 bacterium]|nr:alkaline phosphatase family protein [candidate division KSB1 bacterium]